MSDKQRQEPTGKRPRPEPSKRLRKDVNDIVTDQKFRTWIAPDRDPRKPDTVDVFRDRIRRPDPVDENGDPVIVKVTKQPKRGDMIPVPTVSPKERDRRRGGFLFASEMAPVLDQLEQLRDGNNAKVEMSPGRRAPSSRPPAGADVAELLVDMTIGSANLLRKALVSLGRASETVRRGRHGIRVQLQPDITVTLQRLVDLVDELDDVKLQDEIVRSVRSWKNAARILLSHNAAMSTLEFPCPMCNKQTLMVRSDASSDVVCTNDDCEDDNGNQTKWPRARWALLLQEAGS